MNRMRAWMRGVTIGGLLLLAVPGWAAEGRPVNVNTASMAELTGIRGIGEAKARAIVEHRDKNGPFRSVDELRNVTGIGDKMLSSLRDQVTVGEATGADTSVTR